MKDDRYGVFKVSAGNVRRFLYDADSYEEAEAFCEEHDWCWVDDNEFEWSLEIGEWLGFWTVTAPDGKVYGTDRWEGDSINEVRADAIATFGEGTMVRV